MFFSFCIEKKNYLFKIFKENKSIFLKHPSIELYLNDIGPENSFIIKEILIRIERE